MIFCWILFHNSDLLSNIHQLPNPVPFSGLGSIDIHERGSNHWFGDVYYSFDLPANVSSVSLLDCIFTSLSSI
jgi:hypothetical protein